MNEWEYITSGILQDYCLGALTKEEERKVESMCYEHPKVASELQLLRNKIEENNRSNKIWRSIEFRKSVWEAVKKIWEGN